MRFLKLIIIQGESIFSLYPSIHLYLMPQQFPQFSVIQFRGYKSVFFKTPHSKFFSSHNHYAFNFGFKFHRYLSYFTGFFFFFGLNIYHQSLLSTTHHPQILNFDSIFEGHLSRKDDLIENLLLFPQTSKPPCYTFHPQKSIWLHKDTMSS